MHSEAGSIRGFEVEVGSQAGAIVVALSGELDIATADRLTKALDGLSIAQGDKLAIDLSALEFMDSTGLRLLITANREASENGYEFVVVTGGSPAKRVFELTKMDGHIKVVDSLADLG